MARVEAASAGAWTAPPTSGRDGSAGQALTAPDSGCRSDHCPPHRAWCWHSGEQQGDSGFLGT